MDKDTRMNTPIVGGSSLLVIFAVLCLTVFALLGLSTAQAGQRLSQHSARSVSAYYQAETRAEEIFALLRADQLPAEVTKHNNIYSYSCPISDTQQLRVELQKQSDGWVVLRWQAESITDWQNDDSLAVWDGT